MFNSLTLDVVSNCGRICRCHIGVMGIVKDFLDILSEPSFSVREQYGTPLVLLDFFITLSPAWNRVPCMWLVHRTC